LGKGGGEFRIAGRKRGKITRLSVGRETLARPELPEKRKRVHYEAQEKRTFRRRKRFGTSVQGIKVILKKKGGKTI